jgi:hypothetical protein
LSLSSIFYYLNFQNSCYKLKCKQKFKSNFIQNINPISENLYIEAQSLILKGIIFNFYLNIHNDLIKFYDLGKYKEATKLLWEALKHDGNSLKIRKSLIICLYK